MCGALRYTENLMVSGSAFASALERHGFDFFPGAPCSLIEDLIAVLQTHSQLPHVEDAAVGLGAGAWLGGKRPVILMQNSGLGTVLNALASLALMYGLPSLNQRSPSGAVRLDRLAGAAGHRALTAVTRSAAVTASLRSAPTSPRPHFVLVEVTTDDASVP